MTALNPDELTRRLANGVQPVRVLPPPWRRTAVWLLLATPWLTAAVLFMSPRQDLALRLMDQGWVSQQLVALAVAVLAASAAFSSVIPGHHRRWAGLMLVPLVAWVAGLGQGCLEELSRVGLGGLTPQTDWTCLPGLLATGAVPATVMAFMLRRGAPLTPVWTMVMGGVAAGGLGDFALRLVHSQDVGVMVLAWHIGAVSLLGAVAGLSGPFVLVWRPDVLRSAGAVLS